MKFAARYLTILGLPFLLAYYVLGLWHWNLAIPLDFNKGDATWQLMLTKTLLDTHWVLTNPFLGAPGIAHLDNNSAAQTSALHSVIMLCMGQIIHSPVRLQQTYFLLNFPLICITSYIACRLLAVARLPSFCVGMLFAFTTYRFDNIIYAFLANYFTIPLALVSVIWIISGHFGELVGIEGRPNGWLNRFGIVNPRDFLLGLGFILLITISDGYFSFFTLLLLGFCLFVRLVLGDWRRPALLLPPFVYIFALLGTATVLQLPLHEFEKNHIDEFYPNGVADSTLFKQPFEAEVYSNNLYMMLAPTVNNRFATLGQLGTYMNATEEQATRYPRRQNIRLGTFDSILFCTALILIFVPKARQYMITTTAVKTSNIGTPPDPQLLLDASLSLTLFIFLCAIFGGIGPIIALVFPTIRAYDRFTLFLIFTLLLGAATVVTQQLRLARPAGRFAWGAALVLITGAALHDQIPEDSSKGPFVKKQDFLDEGLFDHVVEAALPRDAMVYQYPYNQYLTNSPYYGWGSFGGQQLYIQSKHLHWSNGGAKNSPADNWDGAVSALPPEIMLNEIEGAGFRGFVIDRSVMTDGQYQPFARAFQAEGIAVYNDQAAQLAFVKLPDPGYRLVYNREFTQADMVVITDPAQLAAQKSFAREVNADMLRQLIASHSIRANTVISRTEHPEIFVDSSTLTRGNGQTEIAPISDMRGRMVCAIQPGSSSFNGQPQIRLTLENQSEFDWQLGMGPFPINIGFHVLRPDGSVLMFDQGYRVPTDQYIRRGNQAVMVLPANLPNLPGNRNTVIKFSLLQDGNAWFGSVSCEVPYAWGNK